MLATAGIQQFLSRSKKSTLPKHCWKKTSLLCLMLLVIVCQSITKLVLPTLHIGGIWLLEVAGTVCSAILV